jgi:hypothetical protein
VSIIAGILTGVLSVAVGDRRIRDTYGSVEQAIAYSRALRTGELPEQIEPDRWRGFLLASVKSNRWAPAAVGVFAVLAVLQSIDRQWPLVALFCAIAIGQTASALVLRRRIARLRDAIDRRSIAAG